VTSTRGIQSARYSRHESRSESERLSSFDNPFRWDALRGVSSAKRDLLSRNGDPPRRDPTERALRSFRRSVHVADVEGRKNEHSRRSTRRPCDSASPGSACKDIDRTRCTMISARPLFACQSDLAVSDAVRLFPLGSFARR